MFRLWEFSPYARWNGAATVSNVRRAVQAMVDTCHGPNDRCVFVDSSHGNGDGKGNTYPCLLGDTVAGRDDDERLGRYWDHQLADDLSLHRTS